jgi:hypothetical protein
LPTSYPTALSEVTVSNGTGNPACNPASTTIKRGEIQRTWKLYAKSFDTDTICVSDLKRADQAARVVSGFERALAEYLTVWWSDWYRIQNIAMVDNRAVTDADTSASVTTSQKGDHTEVAGLPTKDLNWDHLRQIYWDLVRNGLADELAVGRDPKGRPVLPLLAGPGILNRLFTDDKVKEQVKFSDSLKNLQVLGYDGAVEGFLPMVDLFAIRYGNATPIASKTGLTAANMIYPHVNSDATVGRKHGANANYKVSGIAQFEVVTILGRNVWEAQYEAIDPSQVSGASFKPNSYIGEFQWINTPTFRGDNDRQNLGYYLADVRTAAKPIYPELGYSILTKATDI